MRVKNIISSKITFFLQMRSRDVHEPIQEFVLKNKSAGLLNEPQIEMLEKCRNKYKSLQNLTFYNVVIYHKNKRIDLLQIDKNYLKISYFSAYIFSDYRNFYHLVFFNKAF